MGLASCCTMWGRKTEIVGQLKLPHYARRRHTMTLHRLTRRASEEESFATYSAVGSLEAADLLFGAVELVLGSEGLEDLDHVVPELLVVLVE